MSAIHPTLRGRRALAAATIDKLHSNAVVGMVGARQVGKTTLAGLIAARWPGRIHRFDLENPLDVARLADPMLALRDLRGLVIIDEIQHAPALFTVLRVLADRREVDVRFLLLGSASPELLQPSAESLAGRIVYIEVPPFRLVELDDDDQLSAELIARRWLRGGFPRSFLADSDDRSAQWRDAFVQTFLERDLAQLGASIPPVAARRLWTMLAHHHGAVVNVAALSRSLGTSDPTLRRWRQGVAVRQLIEQKLHFVSLALCRNEICR